MLGSTHLSPHSHRSVWMWDSFHLPLALLLSRSTFGIQAPPTHHQVFQLPKLASSLTHLGS